MGTSPTEKPFSNGHGQADDQEASMTNKIKNPLAHLSVAEVTADVEQFAKENDFHDEVALLVKAALVCLEFGVQASRLLFFRYRTDTNTGRKRSSRI